MVDFSREKIQKDFFDLAPDDYFETIDIGNDSLLVVSLMNQMPFESLFLFEDDICYYQSINIYCSPCADEVVSGIVEDKNYLFKSIDGINFYSQKNNRIIMRLKEKLTENGNCNSITIHKLNYQKRTAP